MVNSIPHRIFAISMAFLLIISSTGFSMDMHFCQDELKSINLLGDAKTCHDLTSAPTCHHKADTEDEADKNNCCHNETVVVEKSDVDANKPQLVTVQDIQLDFVVALFATYIFNFDVEADSKPYTQYKPPILDRDVQELYQTFLI